MSVAPQHEYGEFPGFLAARQIFLAAKRNRGAL
jgi:hypothetical protein